MRTGKGNQTIRVQDSANEVLSESVSPDVELIIFTTRMEELASHNILNYSYPRAGVISLWIIEFSNSKTYWLIGLFNADRPTLKKFQPSSLTGLESPWQQNLNLSQKWAEREEGWMHLIYMQRFIIHPFIHWFIISKRFVLEDLKHEYTPAGNPVSLPYIHS